MDPEEKEAPDLSRFIFSSFEVPGKDRVYFIGPFGRRVSFASQQRRAFNIVWALGKSNRFKGAPEIAVIGGGIAGVTASAALIALGCRVTLFEKSSEVLMLQRDTTHRYVHPTVNFWPEKKLRGTTRFPYLDWYEGTCATVVETIREQWTAFEGGLVDLKTCTTVDEITTIGNHVKVGFTTQFEDEPQQIGTLQFDYAFVTTGFGEEKKLIPKDKSYWQRDGVDADIARGIKKWAIGGTGDGGLIEALRILYHDFQKGELCLRIAEELAEAKLSEKLAALEMTVARTSEDDADAAFKYQVMYDDFLAHSVPRNIKVLLDQRRAGMDIRLIGRLPAPFGLYVAPIHKLMIAHALNSKVIQYYQGLLTEIEGTSFIKTETRKRIDFDAGTKVIMRGGPKHPLDDILKKEQEVNKLRERQQSLGDFLEASHIDYDYFPAVKEYPKRNLNSELFVKSRKRYADLYLSEKFACITGLVTGKGKPHLVAVPLDNESVSTKNLPDELFGIFLDRESRVTLRVDDRISIQF